jgi:hypothetical protein
MKVQTTVKAGVAQGCACGGGGKQPHVIGYKGRHTY